MPRLPKQVEVVDEAVAAILRTKTPAERLEMAAASGRMVRMMVRAAIQTDHPDWSEEQIRAEIVRRIHNGFN
jgi:Rv0078B-related antitoxin